ncbi:MAG: preprotein translocase subunit SecG [Verrucomicrobiota bacterium]
MATFLIALFSVVLILICFFVTLLVLMQKPSANSGMGAALGGGAAEQAFGGEATNVLTRGTIYAIIGFFILSFGLYLATLATVERADGGAPGVSLTNIEEEPSTDTPAATETTEDGDQSESTESSAAVSEEGEAVPAEPDTPQSEALQLEDLDKPSTDGTGS